MAIIGVVSSEDRNADCKRLLQERRETSDELHAVVILEIHKNGSQRIFTSRCSMEEKTFLHSFLGAWIARWFTPQSDD